MTDSQALGFLLMDTSFAWKCQGTAEKACQRKTAKRPAPYELESHGRQMSRWALVPGTHLSPDFSLLQPPWQGSENQAVPGGSHGSSLGAEEAGREQGRSLQMLLGIQSKRGGPAWS